MDVYRVRCRKDRKSPTRNTNRKSKTRLEWPSVERDQLATRTNVDRTKPLYTIYSWTSTRTIETFSVLATISFFHSYLLILFSKFEYSKKSQNSQSHINPIFINILRLVKKSNTGL